MTQGKFVLDIRVDPPEVSPGDPVTISESIRTAGDVRITSVRHSVRRAGWYDPAAGRMRTIKPSNRLAIDSSSTFDDLDDMFSYHPWLSPLSINTPERKGLVFRTIAHKIGIYDIYAVWLVGGEMVEGPPAVLTVLPPWGADGQPVLHDDWLD